MVSLLSKSTVLRIARKHTSLSTSTVLPFLIEQTALSTSTVIIPLKKSDKTTAAFRVLCPGDYCRDDGAIIESEITDESSGNRIARKWVSAPPVRQVMEERNDPVSTMNRRPNTLTRNVARLNFCDDDDSSTHSVELQPRK